jgi:hypothetical protein
MQVDLSLDQRRSGIPVCTGRRDNGS